MNVIETKIKGLLILEPKVFGDNRGYFLETWKKDTFQQTGIDCDFVQDNESKSSFGVLRGLHWQASPFTQAKLVRVILGSVLDIAVDIRKGSPTYGQHFAIELNDVNKRQFFIPKGFAHGFAVLSKEAIFSYKCDNLYNPAYERGVRFDDPQLNIDWQVNPGEWNLSEKDRKHPFFKDITPWEENE